MNTSTETLWLVIEKRSRHRSWCGSLRIGKISRRKPDIKIGQALLQLRLILPDGALNPPSVNVEIKPEHLAQPQTTVEAVRQ